MKAEYTWQLLKSTYKAAIASIEQCVTVSRKTVRDYYYTFMASNGLALIFELKFGPRFRTDALHCRSLCLSVYIYAVKEFILHENTILLAIYNY